jgi:hypothetical protein
MRDVPATRATPLGKFLAQKEVIAALGAQRGTHRAPSRCDEHFDHDDS